ncbi:MAG: hydroxyacylglutathione hydrolase [Oceanospirillaceae bacterium]|nr:hydroxyacylglutathione hydrolase [Oceanospirillaceae bacterium]
MFNVSALPAFSDNYIWMLEGDNSQVVVVDPGDAQVVIDALERNNKALVAIFVTHHHSDHTGGVAQLTEKYGVQVYGPSDSSFKGITIGLKDGDTIEELNSTFCIKAVPGHTLDHICYFYNDQIQPKIFCGDSLFLAGCGRVFEGSMRQMLDAMSYFKQLPVSTQLYCTHEYSLANLAFAQAVEPENKQIEQKIEQCKKLRAAGLPTLPSLIESELQINPFLRTNHKVVKQSALDFAQQPLTCELEIFSAIRTWKNNF